MNQQYPSILLEKAVGEFAKLPGVGRKTAMRLVLHLLRQDTATVEAIWQCHYYIKTRSEILQDLPQYIRYRNMLYLFKPGT